MRSFVRICTCFFVKDNSVDVEITVNVNFLSFFLQSFERFYNQMEWHSYNKDLPLQFRFEFTDHPSSMVNKILFCGIKPDISIISYSRYINQVLSKSK